MCFGSPGQDGKRPTQVAGGGRSIFWSQQVVQLNRSVRMKPEMH